MPNYAIITDGVVSNVVVADEAQEDNWVEVAEDVIVGPGFTHNEGDGTFTAPPSPPILMVKSVEKVEDGGTTSPIEVQSVNNLVTFAATDTVRFTVDVEDADGNVLPVDQTFSLPLAGLMGSNPRVINIDFVAGVATVDVANWVTGRWQITEEEVNLDIGPDEQPFEFAGLTIKVTE